jgi:peptidoglycan/xylan/chitin deacetylase (PgdA/CDA1 family)
MHLVSISFDDGFLASSVRTAEIFERRGLRACLNIVATGHLRPWWPAELGLGSIPIGDFALWNELRARGHEIMPHGYRHANKKQLPLAEAQKLITDCLAILNAELHGFDARQAVFNFPYNASTPELHAWLPTVVRAFRTGGDAINPMPAPGLAHLTSSGFGPGRCDQDLDKWVARLLARPSGWLIYCAHGLEDEGWGPMGADYLERLLDRLQAIPTVRIMPVGQALAAADAAQASKR